MITRLFSVPLAWLICMSIVNAADSPAVSLITVEGQHGFEVRGLPPQMLAGLRELDSSDEQWQQVFAVRVAKAADDVPPVLGAYRIEHDVLLFQPRFRLRPGQSYHTKLTLRSNDEAAVTETMIQQFHVESRNEAKQRTELVAIYPTRDVLPENQLKFYLHFSGPMSRGDCYRHIRLLDEKGEEVEFAFLQLPEELWNPELTRFTLFFDPGRIKRGLKPREEFGPSIIDGHSYTLVIENTWADADGRPIKQSVRKAFRVIGPDDIQPVPDRWTLTSPAAGTRAPLEVVFDEPLDHAMLHRVLHVRDAQGDSVSGKIETDEEETVWRFIPTQDWSAGTYELVVATNLEDLAGNSIARPFEVDLFDRVQPTAISSTRLSFAVE